MPGIVPRVYSIFRIILRGMQCYPLFTDEKIEVQKDKVSIQGDSTSEQLQKKLD